jgi:hypothetical protein
VRVVLPRLALSGSAFGATGFCVSPGRPAVEPDYTEFQMAAAEIIVEEHVHICVPEPVCHRCLKPWPCSDVEWARMILAREVRPGG